MDLRAHLCWLPKAGNAVEDYEDAWATSPAEGGEPGVFRCAVADGATETSFSARWARLLTDAYCAGELAGATLTCHLAPLQRAWQSEIDALALPWYAEEKARAGAFAALAGLTLAAGSPEGAGGTWAALAVGDSCLFQVRDDALLVAFPCAEAAAFTSRPTLLSSNPASNVVAGEALAETDGSWRAGDRFYLLTDALACWFLATWEAGGRPWSDLDPFDEPEAAADFTAWIGNLRRSRALKNDDVTLLCVHV